MTAAPDGTVLITGGTGGLGQHVVAALLDAGAEVLVSWIAERERDRLDSHERLSLVQADLSSDEGAADAVAAAEGRLGAVVCLAGGFAAGDRWHEEPADRLAGMLDLNLLTAARTVRAAVPGMIERGGGTVVCVGAQAALAPFAGGVSYTTSKAAVLALVRGLHAEYHGDGIRSNAVLPSMIDTPANREAMPESEHHNLVDPADIARVIRFLSSPDSAATSGAWVPV